MKSPLSRNAQPAETGSHSQKTLLLVVPCQVLRPWKTNIFWRPSSKVKPLRSAFRSGVTVPGTGVRLVQVASLPSHSQTMKMLFSERPRSSTLPRPESVTMPGEPCGPGLAVGKSWLHLRVPLFHSQVSSRTVYE